VSGTKPGKSVCCGGGRFPGNQIEDKSETIVSGNGEVLCGFLAAWRRVPEGDLHGKNAESSATTTGKGVSEPRDTGAARPRCEGADDAPGAGAEAQNGEGQTLLPLTDPLTWRPRIRYGPHPRQGDYSTTATGFPRPHQ
jgi:hypothetical protein